MNSLYELTNNLINQEIPLINSKIKGTSFLEKLKLNFLEKYTKDFNEISKEIDDFSQKSEYEDEYKKILIEFNSYKFPKVFLNNVIKNHQLLICIKEKIIIDLKDFGSKKVNNLNLIPLTGITIPTGSECNINYLKNAVAINIYLEDKYSDIEISKQNTI